MDNQQNNNGLTNPEQEFTPVPTQSTGYGIQTSNQKSGRDKRTYHYIAAIIAVLVIIIAIYGLEQISMVHTNINYTSTIKPITPKPNVSTSINESYAFARLSNFSIKTGLVSLGLYTYSNPTCNYTEYNMEYVQKGEPAPPNPINFSVLNESNPLFIAFSVEVINESGMPAYLSTINATGGFCIPNMQRISQNSVYSHNITYIDGRRVYQMGFSNFTNEGLNLTYNYYIGKRPNLQWNITKTIYKNTALIVNVWSFAGYKNTSLIKNYSAEFYSSFINGTNG
ncbi:MAG: hypothetical protein QXR73_02460 [Candidatus Micrarchaeaceae archaeon]